MTRLSLDAVYDLSSAALEGSGAIPAQAGPVAESVREAEAEGIRNVGLGYLPIYCEHLICGKPPASPRFPSPGPIPPGLSAGSSSIWRAAAWWPLPSPIPRPPSRPGAAARRCSGPTRSASQHPAGTGRRSSSTWRPAQRPGSISSRPRRAASRCRRAGSSMRKASPPPIPRRLPPAAASAPSGAPRAMASP